MTRPSPRALAPIVHALIACLALLGLSSVASAKQGATSGQQRVIIQECEQASLLRSTGHKKEAKPWEKKCKERREALEGKKPPAAAKPKAARPKRPKASAAPQPPKKNKKKKPGFLSLLEPKKAKPSKQPPQAAPPQAAAQPRSKAKKKRKPRVERFTGAPIRRTSTAAKSAPFSPPKANRGTSWADELPAVGAVMDAMVGTGAADTSARQLAAFIALTEYTSARRRQVGQFSQQASDRTREYQAAQKVLLSTSPGEEDAARYLDSLQFREDVLELYVSPGSMAAYRQTPEHAQLQSKQAGTDGAPAETVSVADRE